MVWSSKVKQIEKSFPIFAKRKKSPLGKIVSKKKKIIFSKTKRKNKGKKSCKTAQSHKMCIIRQIWRYFSFRNRRMIATYVSHADILKLCDLVESRVVHSLLPKRFHHLVRCKWSEWQSKRHPPFSEWIVRITLE